jgi:hypothetical protein
VAQRHGDGEDLRPAPRGHAIEVANQLRVEVVGIELFDDQLYEGAGPGERLRAYGEQPQHARAKLVPPSLGIELLFGPEGLFEVTVDVVDEGPDLAHGCSSTGHDAHDDARQRGGGPETARAVFGGCV